MRVMVGLVVGVMLVAACSGSGAGRGAGGVGGSGSGSDSVSVSDAASASVTDAASASVSDSGPCQADAKHCCMPDGRIVKPGGCQPSYPDGVQPATERAPDGTCKAIECYLKCLPADARIATPRGERPVSSLAVGDPVWTRAANGDRVVAPIRSIASLPAPRHVLALISLDDGRVIRASAGHPLPDGRPLAALAAGDSVDGARVIAVSIEAYDGGRTWDLLPAGETGLYWADGVLLGSTLHP